MPLMNTKALTARQLEQVKDIIRAGKGRKVFARGELRLLENKLHGRKYPAHFIVKNEAAKARGKNAERGQYNLEPFIRYAEKHPPKPEIVPTTKRVPAKSVKSTKSAKAPKKAA